MRPGKAAPVGLTRAVSDRMHNRRSKRLRRPEWDATERANRRAIRYSSAVLSLLSCGRPRNSVSRTAFPNRVRQRGNRDKNEG